MAEPQARAIGFAWDRGEGQKGIWTRIGAAWPHGNGNGLSIQLDAASRPGWRA
jgi:hypothetical protein